MTIFAATECPSCQVMLKVISKGLEAQCTPSSTVHVLAVMAEDLRTTIAAHYEAQHLRRPVRFDG